MGVEKGLRGHKILRPNQSGTIVYGTPQPTDTLEDEGSLSYFSGRFLLTLFHIQPFKFQKITYINPH